MSFEARLQQLRGGLEPEGLGSRGIERMARNPGCQRLRAITIAGLKTSGVASMLGLHGLVQGQSPIALAFGVSFETHYLRDNAARLLALYRDAGLLSESECKVTIIPNHADLAGTRGGRAQAIQAAVTRRLFELKLSGDASAPNLIVKPRLTVHILGQTYWIEPDALVASDADPFYRPVEIKSYMDLRGKTSLADLRTALRQAAVGLIALREAVRRDAPSVDAEELAPARCDLVLRRPGSFKARVHTMKILSEVESITRSLDAAPRDLAELEGLVQLMLPTNPAPTLADPEVVRSIPASYRESCREHCDLSRYCRREATAEGSPALLGDSASQALASIDSIDRALALARGADPTSKGERAVAEWLRQALQVYREVI